MVALAGYEVVGDEYVLDHVFYWIVSITKKEEKNQPTLKEKLILSFTYHNQKLEGYIRSFVIHGRNTSGISISHSAVWYVSTIQANALHNATAVPFNEYA